MNKYNHWLGRLFKLIFAPKGKDYAVTIGQTTYYSCPAANVSDRWKWHEDKHKEQWATKGYKNIDYEVEARAASETPLRFGN